MVKNYTESYFKRKLDKKYFSMKIQVNPLAYTKTICDFFCQDKENNYFVECKEVKVSLNKNKYFVLSRFEYQKNKMVKLKEINKNNICYLFLSYLFADSGNYFFLIPVEEYIRKIKMINRKSIRIDDCISLFEKYRIKNNRKILLN